MRRYSGRQYVTLPKSVIFYCTLFGVLTWDISNLELCIYNGKATSVSKYTILRLETSDSGAVLILL